MRVFVTGPTGFIGHAVVAALIDNGHQVTGLARSDASARKVEEQGVAVVRGSLSDVATLARAARDADATIHAGATGGADNGEVDAAAVHAIAEAAGASGARLIYTSGAWVYGDTKGATVDEHAPLDPPAIVAWRPAVERLALGVHGAHAVVIRPGVVYGDRRGLPGMLLGNARDGVVGYVATGDQHWALVHVRDLAELYVHALESGEPGAIYNAVTASEPVRAIAEAAAAHLGSHRAEAIALEDARATLGPFADALALDQRVSSARAMSELDWKPSAPSIYDDFAGKEGA